MSDKNKENVNDNVNDRTRDKDIINTNDKADDKSNVNVNDKKDVNNKVDDKVDDKVNGKRDLISRENVKRKRILSGKLISGIVAVLLAVIIGASAIYVNDYYHADNNAISLYDSVLDNLTGNVEVQKVTKTSLKGGDIAYVPETIAKGMIFYPGGKVEYTAYEPLMKKLASQGILCVLVKMPCNLAVLDMNAANGIQDQYPEVTEWYIGGHSLGGAMAATYVSKHTSEYAGLVLLGAYSTKNISNSGLKVLSIYGSEDRVLDRDKYEKNKTNLPEDYKEYVIYGGCHAYYGMYGAQDGDGIPSITNTLQIDKTAGYIYNLICK